MHALQRRFHINLDYCPDVSHGSQNDFWAAGRDAGLLHFYHMVLLLVNVPMWPWAEGQRHTQMVESMAGTLEGESPLQCPLFMELVADMHAESPTEHDADAGSIEHQIWDELKTAGPWVKQGGKTATSRFLALLRSGRGEAAMWSGKLLAYLTACIELDCAQPKSLNKHKNTDEGAGARSCVARERRRKGVAQGLRQPAQHGHDVPLGPQRLLHIAHRTSVAAALDEWHSHQSERLRSKEQALDWVAEQHRGGSMKHLVHLFRSNSPRRLQHMGITCPTGSGRRAQAFNTSLADEEDGRADILGDTMAAFVGRRLKRNLWLVVGWMTRCVRFLWGTSSNHTCGVSLAASMSKTPSINKTMPR